jgi:subtilisin family serine protease
MPSKSRHVANGGLALDNPAPLGDLAEIFMARNIASAVGPDGHVLLVRPDSALVEVPKDPRRLDAVISFVARVDKDAAGRLREAAAAGSAGFVRVAIRPSRLATERGGESRWSIGAVNEMVSAARDHRGADGKPDPIRAEYNHVVIGAQTFSGSPLGLMASWAGEMAFPGRITKTKDGRTVLLTLAEPAIAPQFLREPLNIHDERPGVLVLDTGLRTVTKGRGRSATRTVAHPDLQNCFLHDDWRSAPTPGVVDDEDEEFDPTVTPTTTPPSTVLDFEAGHGTFIAGIVRQTCPDADVYSAGVLSSFGDGDADGIIGSFKRVKAILEGLGRRIDVVVMSFGANLIDDDPGFFGEELMRVLGDAIGVAAAGNQSTCRPYFPAALPDVIAVGGLATDGKAWFTNFGGWVDACAPAVDVVSTFFTDFQETVDGKKTRKYEGWARWSGTSFSAPKVAALIAQEMYLHRSTAHEAWKRMVSHKHFRYPDLGIVFNV